MRLRVVLDQGAYPKIGYPATGYVAIVRALFPAAADAVAAGVGGLPAPGL